MKIKISGQVKSGRSIGFNWTAQSTEIESNDQNQIERSAKLDGHEIKKLTTQLSKIKCFKYRLWQDIFIPYTFVWPSTFISFDRPIWPCSMFERCPYNWNISIYRKHCQQINRNKHIHNFDRIVFYGLSTVHIRALRTSCSSSSAVTRTWGQTSVPRPHRTTPNLQVRWILLSIENGKKQSIIFNTGWSKFLYFQKY